MARKQIFISHISEESAIAQALKKRLLADFLNLPEIFVSSDRTTIGAGKKWLDEVEKGLKTADLVIVMLSPESVGRPWVNFEAGAVWLRGVPLIPVCHSGTTPETLPMPLNLLQAGSLTDADSLQKIYDAVASQLGAETPSLDFKSIAQEFANLLSQHAASSFETIENPRILCMANEQYSRPEYGFTLDVAAVKAAFPDSVTVAPNCSRKRFLALLAEQRFDIVYLVTPLHPDTGALLFSPVDQTTNLPRDPDPEAVNSDRLSTLLAEAKTRLLVFATCRALVPAVEMATVANMVATEKDVTGQQTSEWAECFFGLLAKGRSVFKAFELTRAQVDTPMRIIRQKDLVFSRNK
jgi:hypothetical protein